jgi:hypothetical protein
MSMPDDEPQSPWVDPIVAELRAARERIVAAVGGDLHALCEQLRARQAAAGRIPIRHAPRALDEGRGGSVNGGGNGAPKTAPAAGSR